MWKLQCAIIRAKDELLATKVLKKYKHLNGAYIFEKSSHWRSSALENMMKEHNNERNRKVAQEGSLFLFESYFLQYDSLLFYCKRQYLKLVNLELYAIVEKFWRDKVHRKFVIVMLVRACKNLIHNIAWKLIMNKNKEYLNASKHISSKYS